MSPTAIPDRCAVRAAEHRTTPVNPSTPSLRARRPERQQQVDQVQHVDRAVIVEVLRYATGHGGLAEAEQEVDQIEDVDRAVRPLIRTDLVHGGRLSALRAPRRA